MDVEPLFEQAYRAPMCTFSRLTKYPKHRSCCKGGNHEKGARGRYSFPTVGFCDDAGVSRSLVGWRQNEDMTLWFLRTQQDTFVVAACSRIDILVVQETTTTRLFNRLNELNLCPMKTVCEAALVTLLRGTDVWTAEGCCVSVNSLVVASNVEGLCAKGIHLESAAGKRKQNNIIPGCSCVGVARIEHWQCAQCAEFARCVYTLALAWPVDHSQPPYIKVCLVRPEGGVMDPPHELDVMYDTFKSVIDQSELDVMWHFVVDGFACKKYTINEDTLASITDFVEIASQSCEQSTTPIDYDLLIKSSKYALQKRQQSLEQKSSKMEQNSITEAAKEERMKVQADISFSVTQLSVCMLGGLPNEEAC